MEAFALSNAALGITTPDSAASVEGTRSHAVTIDSAATAAVIQGPTSATAPESPNTAGKRGAARAQSSSKKAKVAHRLKWTNAMVAEMLRLRFEEGDVKCRLESAETKTKKALAWQQYTSVLSQSQGVVISQAELYQAYRKVKFLYRKGRRERRQTGNNTTEPFAVDEGLWAVLHDAFASRVGLGGEVLLDTHFEEDESEDAGEADASASNTTSPAKGRLQPVVELANALQTGMEAIAASMSATPTGGGHLQQLASAIQQQARAMAEQRERLGRSSCSY
ncbi:hypothetical protein PF011_g3054 [Phytophthora fragariae]|uniref:Uncharacterized protein n=1 Tax=Phytophthora fragariae TaxID=53985 RepID=A0A6A3M1A5_9STRA|nr:hypothetical protein PF011_g3054 [Phytophthora fragariae]